LISSEHEYHKAREEVEHLSHWLDRLETKEGDGFKGLTAASIRNMISRIQAEIADYEVARVSAPAASENANPPEEEKPDHPRENQG
jgi:hypothetical protein